ncbi:MAG TPA: radical SAM protein [Acetobacteraceae bacterium]|nr:radical SAM protein [Acetobacteraceae bacterium]
MQANTAARRLLRDVALAVPSVRRLHEYAVRTGEEVSKLQQQLSVVRAERELSAVSAEQELSVLRAERDELRAAVSKRIDVATAHEALIDLIKSSGKLDTAEIRDLAAAVDDFLTQPRADKIGVHREIGKAIFARSADLYRGKGLPAALARFTYPAFLSILLNTHCNAACFFCREADYKGTAVEFSEVLKLDTAIRHARVVDLTGWGEPFLYPDFEWVVRHVLELNPSPRLIQVTTNGSLLSKRWGMLLAGKVNLIVISLNAATPETYDRQMRYKNKQFTFERVIANLRAFLPELTDEDRDRIDLHMVANSDNFREISGFVGIAADLGIPQVSIGHYISAQKQYAHKTLWNVKQEYNDELARGRELAAKHGIRISGRRFFVQETGQMGAANCMAPFEAIFIESSGKTAPCCFMGNERIENLYRDGFEAVWFSDVMNKLRHDRYLPPCKVCTVFSPFDERTTHISATLLADATLDSRRDGAVSEGAKA